MADDEQDPVDPELDSDETQTEDESQKKVAKHDSGAADLEKVTDYAEEREITSSTFSDLQFISDNRVRDAKAKADRERELAKVAVKKEDVDLIVLELEISRFKAERSLREHNGNLVKALAALTN